MWRIPSHGGRMAPRCATTRALAPLRRCVEVGAFALGLPCSLAAKATMPQAPILRPQPFGQLRPPSPPRYVAHCDSYGLLLADQDNKLFAAGHNGVEQVPLQHCVLLRHDGN